MSSYERRIARAAARRSASSPIPQLVKGSAEIARQDRQPAGAIFTQQFSSSPYPPAAEAEVLERLCPGFLKECQVMAKAEQADEFRTRKRRDWHVFCERILGLVFASAVPLVALWFGLQMVSEGKGAVVSWTPLLAGIALILWRGGFLAREAKRRPDQN